MNTIRLCLICVNWQSENMNLWVGFVVGRSLVLPFVEGIIPFLFVFVDSPVIASIISKSNNGRTPIRYHSFINLPTLWHGSKSFIHCYLMETQKMVWPLFTLCIVRQSNFMFSFNQSVSINTLFTYSFQQTSIKTAMNRMGETMHSFYRHFDWWTRVLCNRKLKW